MARAIVLLLDSFGIGASDDAADFGDVGADTLGNIAKACADWQADKVGLRSGPLKLPNLCRLGLSAAWQMSTNKQVPGLEIPQIINAKYGYAVEQSNGKDTPSGHWEIAGVPVSFDWGYFPGEYPSFPESLVESFVTEGELNGILGNCAASGTEILKSLGEEHMTTGKPIVYTSGDSVFQIAAHEDAFGLNKLYKLCDIARKLVDPYNIGRVIARPFLGEPGEFYRTGNRRDLSMPPPAPTLLERLVDEGGTTIAVGKTADIFAHRGISQTIKATGLDKLFDATVSALEAAPDNSLIFTNFVDFDSHYGHRRDVIGYANALEQMDQRIPELEAILQPGDCVVVTADHGCDPTREGSDHTREHIPVLIFGPGLDSASIGRRESFADIGQSIAAHLNMRPLAAGTSFL